MQGKIVNNTPYIDFELYGTSPELSCTMSGIVDTGFTGFLKIPYIKAFPVGLILIGTETSTIADGSQSSQFSCMGTFKVFGLETITAISVAPKSPILIGVQLLVKLGLHPHFDFDKGIITFTHRPPRKKERKTETIKNEQKSKHAKAKLPATAAKDQREFRRKT